MIDLLEHSNEEQDSEVVEAIVLENNDALLQKEAYEREVIRRKAMLSKWAEEKKVLCGAPPKTEDLEKVYEKLRSGSTIMQAIEGICSYFTWSRWRNEYPEVAAIEEEARNKMVDDYQKKQLELANGLDLDGNKTQAKDDNRRKIDRARLQIETLQKQIERVDRLTENRMKAEEQKTQTFVPIQINVAYGKEGDGVDRKEEKDGEGKAK